MLSSILAPLAEGGRGAWPPSGVEQALPLWYEAVFRIRNQLTQWMDKQSKHVIVSSITCAGCIGVACSLKLLQSWTLC